MNAIDLTPSHSPTARQSHFALFDAINDPIVGYGHVTLFERHSPGASDSLRVWAELHRIPVIAIHYDDPTPMDGVRVSLPHGAWLEVLLS